MVKVHEARGYRFYFYEGEVTLEPPHVHIKGEKGRMKIWLFSLEIAHCRGIPAHEQNKILEIVEENRQAFLKK
jgi:hypothetical protein